MQNAFGCIVLACVATCGGLLAGMIIGTSPMGKLDYPPPTFTSDELKELRAMTRGAIEAAHAVDRVCAPIGPSWWRAPEEGAVWVGPRTLCDGFMLSNYDVYDSRCHNGRCRCSYVTHPDVPELGPSPSPYFDLNTPFTNALEPSNGCT